ncbi:hypothetical protein [Rhodalgimonas zhirmunskyi]|uniref:Uncharacterized protein n=1 Tax=Rhodalgimonas zhirmunskyi TaxID=2964767 RepID=A0AAJ1UB02_9RHOB|nr:hypothetical protein [Rhodoalgimonas zhirmunskyi]MDQ2095190.1 hypothetical protein [Rhodoalgimonas zhirmunskyi]
MVALKNAVVEGKFDTGRDEFVYIGAPSKLYRTKTFLDNGVIRSKGKATEMFLQTSEGQYDAVDPKDFDAVVIYGGNYHLQGLFASLLRASSQQNNCFSSAFLTKGSQGWLEKTRTIDTIREMKARADAQIVLMFEPFFSERYKKKMPEGAVISEKTRDIVFDALREVVEDAGAICLFQPEETITDVIYSHHELAQDSRRMVGGGTEAHDNEDLTHLNSTYGAKALEKIRTALT